MTNDQYLMVAAQALEARDYYAARQCAQMACRASAPRSEQERLTLLAYVEICRLTGQSHIHLTDLSNEA